MQRSHAAAAAAHAATAAATAAPAAACGNAGPGNGNQLADLCSIPQPQCFGELWCEGGGEGGGGEGLLCASIQIP
eukprot:983813-Pelagomonas_calceolata.AAC.9